MPLTLLAVTHYPPMAGGSSRSCALLFDRLARSGHRVHVLAPITAATAAYDREHREGLPCTLSVSRYELPHISLIQFDTRAFVDDQRREHAAIRRRLPELIDRVQPDVVIAAHETLGAAVVEQAHAAGRPCAVLLRGSPTWQIVTGVYPPGLTARYLDLFRSADLLIPVARYLQTGLASLGIPRIEHIPNLVDLEQFAPSPPGEHVRARYGIPPGSIVVLHPSTMVSRKRGEDILQAAEITAQVMPALFYVFAGGEDRSATLEAMSRRGAAAGRVRFVPRVPYTAMPELYNAADIVVMASEGEGMSRVYLEAQACGRALVASHIPPACEVIEHGVTGLLFPTGNVAALAERILEAAGSPVLRERLGQAARTRVGAHAIDAVAQQYAGALQGLAVSRSQPG